MINHIIKHEYIKDQKLTMPVLWCGRTDYIKHSGMFESAQAAALAADHNFWPRTPCKSCIKAIISALNKGLHAKRSDLN